MKDSELDQLLKNAAVTVPAPAGFQRDVWFRIQADEANGWKPRASRILEGFLGWFALPPVAVATCSVMVVAGVWFGMEPQASGAAGEIAYIQSVSPFAHNQR